MHFVKYSLKILFLKGTSESAFPCFRLHETARNVGFTKYPYWNKHSYQGLRVQTIEASY